MVGLCEIDSDEFDDVVDWQCTPNFPGVSIICLMNGVPLEECICKLTAAILLCMCHLLPICTLIFKHPNNYTGLLEACVSELIHGGSFIFTTAFVPSLFIWLLSDVLIWPLCILSNHYTG